MQNVHQVNTLRLMLFHFVQNAKNIGVIFAKIIIQKCLKTIKQLTRTKKKKFLLINVKKKIIMIN